MMLKKVVEVYYNRLTYLVPKKVAKLFVLAAEAERLRKAEDVPKADVENLKYQRAVLSSDIDDLGREIAGEDRHYNLSLLKTYRGSPEPFWTLTIIEMVRVPNPEPKEEE